jgi:hypothetical protein
MEHSSQALQQRRIAQSPVESPGLGHQSHKTPYYVRFFSLAPALRVFASKAAPVHRELPSTIEQSGKELLAGTAGKISQRLLAQRNPMHKKQTGASTGPSCALAKALANH